MINPENEAIAALLDTYAYHRDKLIKKYSEIEDSYFEYDKKYEELTNKVAQAIKILFKEEKFSFADIYFVEDFNKSSELGYFNFFDGVGYYVDEEGNELGSINWNNLNDYPKNALFVLWYNK